MNQMSFCPIPPCHHDLKVESCKLRSLDRAKFGELAVLQTGLTGR